MPLSDRGKKFRIKKIQFRENRFFVSKIWLIWPNPLRTCWSLCSESPTMPFSKGNSAARKRKRSVPRGGLGIIRGQQKNAAQRQALRLSQESQTSSIYGTAREDRRLLQQLFKSQKKKERQKSLVKLFKSLKRKKRKVLVKLFWKACLRSQKIVATGEREFSYNI